MSTPEPKPGQRFQDFVAVLERAFGHADGVTIHSPYKLRDKDTGRLREHDVVIVRKTHHGETLTAVECKDRGRPIGVDFVEQFSKKNEKTGIHHGIIVSATGFAETAKTKAKALNITCMTLAEAESHPWVGTSFIVSSSRNFLHLDIFVGCKPTGGPGPVQPSFPYFNDTGDLFTAEAAKNVLQKLLPEEAYAPPFDGVREGRCLIPITGLHVIDANGERFEAVELDICYKLEIVEESHPFELHNYTGEAGAYEIASGDLVVPGINAKVVMIKQDDGSVVVSLATGPKKDDWEAA